MEVKTSKGKVIKVSQQKWNILMDMSSNKDDRWLNFRSQVLNKNREELILNPEDEVLFLFRNEHTKRLEAVSVRRVYTTNDCEYEGRCDLARGRKSERFSTPEKAMEYAMSLKPKYWKSL